MAELDLYWALVPCVILGFLVGWLVLPRVGTLWATLPFATLVAMVATSVVLHFAVARNFAWCGTGVTKYIVGTYLTLGTLAVLTTQGAAAVGNAARRHAASHTRPRYAVRPKQRVPASWQLGETSYGTSGTRSGPTSSISGRARRRQG